MTFQRILVGLDDSPAGFACARFAVDLGVRLGSHVRLVHVVSDGDVVRALGVLRRNHGIDERRRHGAESLLAHVLAEATEAGLDAEGETFLGEPAPVLLAQAREWDADLVVLGHSHRTGPGRLAIGGVTRQVLEFSECPVLVVPRQGGR